MVNVVDLPWRSLSSPVWGYFSIRNAMRSVRAVRKNGQDITLCVGPGHLPIAAFISCFLKVPHFFYAVGKSMSPALRFFLGSIIANCEETQDSFAQWLKRNPKTIPVIRARINLSVFKPSVQDNPDRNTVKAVTMSRLVLGKSEGIAIMMKAILMLNKKNKRIDLEVFGDGDGIEALKAEADRINDEVGINIISIRGKIRSVQNELPYYDIALGIGRGTWESMACGIPTIVVGKEGLGGIVCSETLSKLMRHNFTARGNREKRDTKDVADAIETLLDDPDYRKEVGDYGLDVVRKHYDVRTGARYLERILQHAVTAGSDRCLPTNPALLISLIFLKVFHVSKCLAKWICHPRESLYVFQNTRNLSRCSQNNISTIQGHLMNGQKI